MVNRGSNVHYWLAKPYRLILAICLLFLLIFGTASYIGYQHYNHDKTRMLSSDRITANLLSRFLSEHQKASIAVLQSYANRPSFINAVRKKDSKKVLFHLAQLKEADEKIDALLITDRNGVCWASYPLDSLPLNQNFSHRDWYKNVSKEWKPHVSSIYKRMYRAQDLAVAVCVPVFDENGHAIGILGISQSLPFLSSIIQQIPLGDHRSATLVDQAGGIVYSNKYPYAEEVASHPLFGFIRRVIQEHKGFVEVNNPSEGGRKTFITLVPLRGIEWTVVIERTSKDILKAAHEYISVLMTVSTLCFVIISLSLVYARKSFILSETAGFLAMEKRLRQNEERFAELFEHISSGVAVYEARNNGEDFIFKEFNKAGERIDGISREEVIGKSIIEMFPGVKDFGIFDVFQMVYKTGKSEKLPAALYKDERTNSWRESYVYKLSSGEVVAVYDDVTHRKEAEQKLLRQGKELRTMAARFTEIEEHRRRGLSRELHDQVGQNLTALGINLTVLRTLLPKEGYEAIQARISDSLSLVDETGDRVRNMMAYLRPPVLDDYGLLAALRWHSGLFAARTGLSVDVQGEELLDRLEAHIENGLFRITQEALTNVVKHAGATHVTISLGLMEKILCLVIADNGIGFDTAHLEMRREPRGWGLATMRERALAIEGNLHVESLPGKGTKIIVVVPQ